MLKKNILLLIWVPIFLLSIFPSVVAPEEIEKPDLQKPESSEGTPEPQPPKDKNQEHTPSSPTIPGYTETETAKIAAGGQSLANHKVKVVVNSFRPSKTKLGPDLSSQFVAFDASNYTQSPKSITVLVPKKIAEVAANLRPGEFLALYGQLAGFFSRKTTSSGRPVTDWAPQLMLMVDRIEPHR